MLILLRFIIAFILLAAVPQSDLLAQPSPRNPQTEVRIDELSVKDMDIAEVLALISRKSGLNIVASKNVTGKVTIFLKKVDAREALRTIVEMNDLAYIEEGNIIRVMTAGDYATRYGQPFGVARVTRVIKLHYVPLKDLVPLLMELKSVVGKVIPNEDARTVAIMDTTDKVKAMEELIREVDLQTGTITLSLSHVRAGDICDEVRAMANPSVGTVECDTVGNRVLVTDTLAGLEKIRRAVETLDARGLNILLEAKLVHIVLNEEHLNGIDWAGIVSDVRDIRLEGSYPFMNSGGRGALLSLGVISDEDLQPLIEALDTIGIVKEYPEADIMITPDVEAKLRLRFDAPGLSLEEASLKGREDDVDLDENGSSVLEFLVKPVVAADGSITASVVPHETTQALVGAVRTPRGEKMDLLDGNSLVLGSVISAQNEATVQKIPLVGDIPLLGFAFRYHKSSMRREEFIVFLTPKIVRSPVNQPAAQEAAPAVPEKEDTLTDPAEENAADTKTDTSAFEAGVGQAPPAPMVEVSGPRAPAQGAAVVQGHEPVTK